MMETPPLIRAIQASQEAERIRYAKMAGSGMKGCKEWSRRNISIRTIQLREEVGRG